MFISKEFKEAWETWKKHKQEKHGSPYTQTSEQKALSSLFRKSHGIEKLAIASIDESIEHNWASIYITKNFSTNGNSGQTSAGQSGYRDSVKEEFNRRYG